MCIGENSAPHAEHYINAQLGALWENAVECVSHHGKGLKPSENQKYSFALAEYYYGKHRAKGHATKADMMFHASFGKPRIEFICNHDALIHLTLKEGHYNTEFAKADSHVTAAHERNRSFTNVTATFRVSYKLQSLSGEGGRIGGGKHVINLFFFDFHKAHTVHVNASEDVGKQALAFYLLHYLRFLSNAGHHVLFSLPDFDDDKLSVTIDFSTMTRASALIEEVRGVSLEKINAFLSTAWLNAAMLASVEHTMKDIKTCLAEYRSMTSVHGSDIHFHVKLGAPRIKALCEQEVILYFTIDELIIYESDDFNVIPQHTFEGWEIACLVNLVTTIEEEDNVIRCRLDFDSARFVRHYCNFPGLDEGNSEIVRIWTRVVEFFTTEYFDILESAHYHIIYHHDHRWPKPSPIPVGGPIDYPLEPEEGPDAEPDSGVIVDVGGSAGGIIGWKEISEKVDMCGFDQIMAISQGSIIAHFHQLWHSAHTSKEASLIKWSYEEFFEATFKPLTLRLLSNGRAIVWVHLQEGFLRTLRNWLPWKDGVKYSFEDWSLAFEVDIKIADHTNLHELSSAWHTKFESSHAFKEHGHHTDRVLKHIYLDFRSAEFVHEFSSFEGLFQSHEKRPIDKVQAVVTYLKKYYFDQITSAGYHILNTIPVWQPGSTPPSYGLTECNFHVYCKHVLERHSWGTFSKADEPAIVIIGMTGFRPMPSNTLKFSVSWIAQAIRGISYGTVCLSKRVFMDERLLKLLARVNALTTIVPLFAGVDNGAWRLELTTWAKHEIRKNRACDWVAVNKEGGILKYKWEHRDGWSYEHEGSDHITNGIYTTSCVTNNYLEIPTTFNRGVLEIKLHGTATLKMAYKGATGSWGTEASASWGTSLVIKSDGGGLKVELVGSPAPVYKKVVSDAKNATLYTDPETLLKGQLPGTVQLVEVLNELKSFEGAWHGCYTGLSAYELTQPIFNANGDLLFKLRPFGLVTRTVTKTTTTTGTVVAEGSGTATGSISRIGTARGKVRPSLSSQRSRTSFLTKAKELVHTVLVGEHTHPGQNGNGKKKAKKEKDDDSSSSSSSDDEGEVTEREQIVETVSYTIA